MIRHDDDNNLSSGTCYTLYLEYLGGLVPLLKGKRTSKIRPEFVIFDPQVEGTKHIAINQNSTIIVSTDIHLQWSPESKSSNSSQSTSGGVLLTDSSDSDREEGCTSSPRMQRRRKRRNKSHTRVPTERQSGQSSGDAEPEDLAYVDTLPEHVRLVEVTSNIWGTKFKIHGLANSVPANLGQVTYKTSLLHLQPRQMTLVMTELRDDFPVVPDPNFNPNLFSEDEEEVQIDGKKIPRVSIDNSPPIAPMSPRGGRLNKPKPLLGNLPSLAKAESYEDEFQGDFCDNIRPQTSNSTNLNLRPCTSTSFVGQYRNGGANTNQRHAISPLCCEGSVPALQSPKNAVAPSDIIFDRPPAQTLIYSSPSDYTQQVKNNIVNEHHQKLVKCETMKKELSFIDDLEAIPGPSTPIRPSNTFCLADSMVRSCSVGYLDMVDAQLVPSDVALLMLRKDAPKRLVLVNRKQKTKKNRQTREKKSPKLKNCGKSRSLDSSDLFPSDSHSTKPTFIEEIIPEVGNKSSSSSPENVDENSNKKETKLGFFASRSPLMRRKKTEEVRGRPKQKTVNQENQRNGMPLHTQALANLEKLITRLREDDRGTPPPTPRLPRSSPASPAPSKKGKRPQSASPIRKNLLSSPLLGRRSKKNRHQESSDDEVNASGDEVFNGTNYRDLETFQKAQLRQKVSLGIVVLIKHDAN